jgi:hypothetical protein
MVNCPEKEQVEICPKARPGNKKKLLTASHTMSDGPSFLPSTDLSKKSEN